MSSAENTYLHSGFMLSHFYRRPNKILSDVLSDGLHLLQHRSSRLAIGLRAETYFSILTLKISSFQTWNRDKSLSMTFGVCSGKRPQVVEISSYHVQKRYCGKRGKKKTNDLFFPFNVICCIIAGKVEPYITFGVYLTPFSVGFS